MKATCAIPCDILPGVVRKPHALQNASRLAAGNLELLKGDQAGRHGLQVNDQYRITFRHENGDAYAVRCEDYQRASEEGSTEMARQSRIRTGEIPATGLPTNRPPTHPGEMLLEKFLKIAQMSQAEAARRMGMPVNRVNELVKGKRGITARSAIKLSRLFGTTPEFWMGLQSDWELWHALQEENELGRAS